jgi:hypothetical protein
VVVSDKWWIPTGEAALAVLGIAPVSSLSRNPIANVGRALTEFDTVRLTSCEEAHRILVDQSHFFKVQNDPV